MANFSGGRRPGYLSGIEGGVGAVDAGEDGGARDDFGDVGNVFFLLPSTLR